MRTMTCMRSVVRVFTLGGKLTIWLCLTMGPLYRVIKYPFSLTLLTPALLPKRRNQSFPLFAPEMRVLVMLPGGTIGWFMQQTLIPELRIHALRGIIPGKWLFQIAIRNNSL